MIPVTATPKARRQSHYHEQLEQPADVTYASVVVLVLAFSTLVGLGGWLLARKRRRTMKRKLAASMVPPTPQIAIQEYKPEYDRVSFHLAPPATAALPSPVHLSPAWSAQTSVSPRVSVLAEPTSKALDGHSPTPRYQIERPARATLPAIGSKRLSLHLPTSSSLSLELQDVVNASIGSAPSLILSSASDSSISATTSTDSDISCITQSQSEPLTLLRKHVAEDPVHPKSGHISMFTLPPIIASPAFTEVSEWDEEDRSSVLLSVVVVSRDASPEHKAGLLSTDVALSDTHQDLIHNFKRFSTCAFTSSSTLSSNGSVRQVPSKDSALSELSGVEARGSFDGRCKSPNVVNVEGEGGCRPAEAVVTTFASQPQVELEGSDRRQSLPPWEKVALLSQKHVEAPSAHISTPPPPPEPTADVPEQAGSATLRTPATLDLPFASPQIPNTPEIVLRGMRSQIFESPVIPSQFSTPATDMDGFDDGQEGVEVEDDVDGLTGAESILNGLGLGAPEDAEIYSQSLQSTPRAPSQLSPATTMNFLVGSPSFEAVSPIPFENTLVVDDFTREILNMVPRGDTPTPSGSGSSLNQALVGIGLAFVGTESNSEPDLGILSSMDSVVTRRYLARELAASLGTGDTMDSLSSVEQEEEMEELPVGEELQSSPTIDAIIKMDRILDTNLESVEVTTMAPATSEQVVSPVPDVGSLPSSPEFDLKASGLADGSRHSWVLMQAVRTLVSTARSATVAPRPASLHILAAESDLTPPPLSAASTSSFASSVEEPRTPLCPPLVLVTSPSVGVLLKQFGSSESIMNERGDKAVFVIQSDSDSDYGASDEESGSDYDVDEPFDLENGAQFENGGESDRRRSAHRGATTKTSSATILSPSSSGSSAASSTRIPALRRNKLKSPVIDFTEGGRHTVQVVHRPKRHPSLRIGQYPHFSSTVVRRHRAASHIPRYRRHRRASKEVDHAESKVARSTGKRRATQPPGSSPSLGGMTEGEDDDLLVNQTFPGGFSCSSTENDA
ncbi:hypothetical protein FRC04_006879 [Tulasnella sp. 424]|nr:hypothetical protein FRC04_006879 [Tulasnella sp. 424]KAG8974384.1 hypothetical protein FRC05_007545 [Tulasnella sp. 425]